MTEKTFKSLTNQSPAYQTKNNGPEFKASLLGFVVGKDAEVTQVGERFLVKAFVPITGVLDLINESLDLALEESKYEGQNKTTYNLPANLQIWTYSEDEANALASKLVVGAKVSTPVRVGYHEYNDKIYLQMTHDETFVTAPKEGSGQAASGGKRKGGSSAKSKGKTEETDSFQVDEEDLPF